MACLIMCQAFITGPPATSPALQVLDEIGTLRGWGIAYGLVGVAGLTIAVCGRQANWLVLIMGALWGAWGFVFLAAWITGGQPRGYVTATWLLLIDVLLAALLLLPSRR